MHPIVQASPYLQVVTTALSSSDLRHFNELQRKAKSIVANLKVRRDAKPGKCVYLREQEDKIFVKRQEVGQTRVILFDLLH